MSNVQEYELLKRAIVDEIPDTFDLEKIKLYFALHVKSRRLLSRVKSLEDVFLLLEAQEIIHANEVTALHCIGKELKNQNVINLVNGYQKMLVESKPCLCGDTSHFSPMICKTINKTSEEYLLNAMANVAENIGSKWRILASELNIPENCVDEIRALYPSDKLGSKQAWAALSIWKKLNEESATTDMLKKALEARLCKRQGIGVHMLKPAVSVE